MSDSEKLEAEEECQPSEISEQDLVHVAAAATSYDLKLANESNDESNSQVGVFQKPGTP